MYHLRLRSSVMLFFSHTAQTTQNTRNVEQKVAEAGLDAAEPFDLAVSVGICYSL